MHHFSLISTTNTLSNDVMRGYRIIKRKTIAKLINIMILFLIFILPVFDVESRQVNKQKYFYLAPEKNNS